MSTYGQLLYEKLGRTGRITLNRPRYRNAQSTVLLKELDRAFEAAALDDDVKVIILAGAGEHFPPVMISARPTRKRTPTATTIRKGLKNRHIRSWEIFLDNTLRWRNLPKPTIAQVQGFCIFGGYMFAAAMDLIVAADDAMFLPSLTQYFSAPWDMGVRKAKEILFQSRFIDAQEALRTGLANMVVPRAELEKETLALADAHRRDRRIYAADAQVRDQQRAGRDGFPHCRPQCPFASFPDARAGVCAMGQGRGARRSEAHARRRPGAAQVRPRKRLNSEEVIAFKF